MNFKDIVTLIIAIAAIGFFFFGIIRAIHYSNTPKPGDMPGFLRNAILLIGGLLATNFGAVYGVNVAQGGGLASGLLASSSEMSEIFREICALLYLLALVIAFIYWATKKFTNDPVNIVDSIPLLSKTLLGIMVAMLALWL